MYTWMGPVGGEKKQSHVDNTDNEFQWNAMQTDQSFTGRCVL